MPLSSFYTGLTKKTTLFQIDLTGLWKKHEISYLNYCSLSNLSSAFQILGSF